jgi:hypothetical protein
MENDRALELNSTMNDLLRRGFKQRNAGIEELPLKKYLPV